MKKIFEFFDKNNNEIKVGDFVIITEDLYKLYPDWANGFRDDIKNKTPLEVLEIKFSDDVEEEGICVFFNEHARNGYYVPVICVIKVEPVRNYTKEDPYGEEIWDQNEKFITKFNSYNENILGAKVGDKVKNLRRPELGEGIVRKIDGNYCIIDFEVYKGWVATLSNDIYEFINKPFKIRWYNKGKLSESITEEDIDFYLNRNLYLTPCNNILIGVFPKRDFEIGDRVFYWGSEIPLHNGQECTIIKNKKDGVYVIEFDDGLKHNCGFFRLEKIIGKYKAIKNPDLDPYDEEIWGIEKVQEKYGFPDSISPIKDFLVNFINKKFDWWLNRKGPANYSEEFVFDMDDIDPQIRKNKDFPLHILRLTIKILSVISFYGKNSVGGSVSLYKRKKEIDSDYSLSKIYRGHIQANLDIMLYPGRDVIEKQLIKEKIRLTVTHELQHLYSGYKKSLKNYDPKNDFFNILVSHSIINLANDYTYCETLDDLTTTYYAFSGIEFSAYISEFTNRDLKINEIDPYKEYLNISKMDFETLYDKIIKEFKKYYPKVNVDGIPVVYFYKPITYALAQRKINNKDKEVKKFNTDFKSFIKLMYDDIKRKGPKFIKKSNKALYGL